MAISEFELALKATLRSIDQARKTRADPLPQRPENIMMLPDRVGARATEKMPRYHAICEVGEPSARGSS